MKVDEPAAGVPYFETQSAKDNQVRQSDALLTIETSDGGRRWKVCEREPTANHATPRSWFLLSLAWSSRNTNNAAAQVPTDANRLTTTSTHSVNCFHF